MATDLEQTLATIAKFADERKQRLARVTVGEISFELLDVEHEAKPADPKKEEQAESRPVNFDDFKPFRDPRQKDKA